MRGCACPRRWPLSQFPVPFLHHTGRPSRACARPCGLICLSATELCAAVGQRAEIRREKTQAVKSGRRGLKLQRCHRFRKKTTQILGWGWGWGQGGAGQNGVASAGIGVKGRCELQLSPEHPEMRNGPLLVAGNPQLMGHNVGVGGGRKQDPGGPCSPNSHTLA